MIICQIYLIIWLLYNTMYTKHLQNYLKIFIFYLINLLILSKKILTLNQNMIFYNKEYKQ